MKCLVLPWRPEPCQVSLIMIYFVYKPLKHCIWTYICLSAAPLCYLCFEVEGCSTDFDLHPVFGLLCACHLSFCILGKSIKVLINQNQASRNTNTRKANQNTFLIPKRALRCKCQKHLEP